MPETTDVAARVKEMLEKPEGSLGFTIESSHFHWIDFWLENGEWQVQIGCQKRTLERWLRYGRRIAESQGLKDAETEYYTQALLAFAAAKGVAVPENVGNDEIDVDDVTAFESPVYDDDDDDWDDDDDDWNEDGGCIYCGESDCLEECTDDDEDVDF